MADRDELEGRAPDPFVRDRLAAGASGPVDALSGLWGDSDRPGCRRLYLTTRLDYFVEFRVDDVVAVDAIPPEEPPFVGLDATRVLLARGATVDWVRRQVGAADQFAVEARDATVQPQFPETWEARCPGVTHHFGRSDFDICDPGTGRPGGGGVFGPWPTRGVRTCATCNEGTCVTCDQGTCLTCGRNTCATCEGMAGCESVAGTCWTCGRATCAGCTADTCAGDTCATCASCAGSCAPTCGGTCASCRGTCDASCQGTCANTCDASCAGTCRDTCADTCVTCAGTCQATCDTCWTCFLSCGHCDTDPGWCFLRG